MANSGMADHLIKEAGCGPFQVTLVFLVSVVPKIGAIYAAMFMAFGNYNPGWRCLDNSTENFHKAFMSSSEISEVNFTSHSDSYLSFDSTKSNKTSEKYTKGSCELFQRCENVEFNPDTSTIVTEWGLLCDKSWAASLIISVQMSGILIGSLVSGQFGDTFGRQKMFYVSFGSIGVLSIVSVFSSLWQMFAVIEFFIGLALACIINLYSLYPAEFLDSKWRTRDSAIPAKNIGGLIFAVAVIMCKDWKLIQLICGAFFIAFLIPSLIWVPESLRWLEIKSKQKEFQKVAKRLITMNKLNIELNSCDQTISHIVINDSSEVVTKIHTYTVLDLFRKGYKLYTFIVGFVRFIPAVVYYVISFDVKSLHGNFYLNLITLCTADIPFLIFPMYVPNIIGRKRAGILFTAITALSLLIATGVGFWVSGDVKYIILLILVVTARVSSMATISNNNVMTSEIYPTVVRSIVIGYCSFMTRVGGILAPLFISEESQAIYIYYGIMGAACLLACLSIHKLPETRKSDMKEVFDNEEAIS